MATATVKAQAFNILIVGQSGRLQYEAVLFAASLRLADPGFAGRLFVAEPQKGKLWRHDPRIADPMVRAVLADLGAEILPFDNKVFGESYPYGNKIEALAALPPDEPFVFFDTDTLVLGPLSQVSFDFDRPSASLRREGTWPVIELYGPGYGAIWRSLHERFGLDYPSTLDLSQPDEYWQRYLYFNAGWFFYRSPREFGARFLSYATEIRDNPPEALVCQTLDPWLDQVALPLVIHSFGGGRHSLPPGLLDGSVTCHYRVMPLLYARESDAAVAMLEQLAAPNAMKRLLREHLPVKRMVYQGQGVQARALFDRADLPGSEKVIRQRLKAAGLWLR